MSDREKEPAAESGSELEPDAEELTADELGVVFGGWHPGPPAPEPPSHPSGAAASGAAGG